MPSKTIVPIGKYPHVGRALDQEHIVTIEHKAEYGVGHRPPSPQHPVVPINLLYNFSSKYNRQAKNAIFFASLTIVGDGLLT
jgi:hypothetical protein